MRARMPDDQRTVIVVDDSDEIRDVLTLLLEDEGYRVLPVEDGATALLMTRRFNPSLITLDIGLPHEDGREILRQLKSAPDTRSIPVIVVTGQENAREQIQLLGADGILLKPFELHDVRALVGSLLRCAS